MERNKDGQTERDRQGECSGREQEEGTFFLVRLCSRWVEETDGGRKFAARREKERERERVESCGDDR